MRGICIDNLGAESALVLGKEYELSGFFGGYVGVRDIGDVNELGCYTKSRFQITPSMDDVVKDKLEEQKKMGKTMTGLEAIDFMKQDKIAQLVENDIYLYRIQNGQVYWTTVQGLGKGNSWLLENSFDFTGSYLEYTGSLLPENWQEQINFKQKVFEKLQRFSDENGGNEIDWYTEGVKKYFIRCDYRNTSDEHLRIGVCWRERNFGQVYFISREVAKEALNLFQNDLKKCLTTKEVVEW